MLIIDKLILNQIESTIMNKKFDNFLEGKYSYIWSDSWCLDKNKAWLMAGTMDALFSIDRETGLTTLVSKIPADRIYGFRKHPRCIKKENILICLPDNESYIWLYDILDNNSWSSIHVDNPKEVRLLCTHAWFVKEHLYIVSRGLKQIIEVDIKSKTIEKYYQLPVGVEEKIFESAFFNDCLYIVGGSPSSIYKFNCKSKNTIVYELDRIDDQLRTICFDGKSFWLSGFSRKIYVWEENSNRTTMISDFPCSFGIWNFSGKYKSLLSYDFDTVEFPLFLTSISVGEYIWFIPFQTNQILYIDKNTYDIKAFEVEGEEQKVDNLETQFLNHKYLLEYIRENRYIGLLSIKNKWIIEIDSQNLSYEIFEYHLDLECKLQIYKCFLEDYFKCSDILLESESLRLEEMINHLILQKNIDMGGEKRADLCGDIIFGGLQKE